MKFDYMKNDYLKLYAPLVVIFSYIVISVYCLIYLFNSQFNITSADINITQNNLLKTYIIINLFLLVIISSYFSYKITLSFNNLIAVFICALFIVGSYYIYQELTHTDSAFINLSESSLMFVQFAMQVVPITLTFTTMYLGLFLFKNI
jgi:hypothetical protein